jgi:hypothetical protein
MLWLDGNQIFGLSIWIFQIPNVLDILDVVLQNTQFDKPDSYLWKLKWIKVTSIQRQFDLFYLAFYLASLKHLPNSVL